MSYVGVIKKQEETLPSPELYTDMGGKVSLQLPIGSKGEKELPNIINFTDQYDKIADLKDFAEQSASPSLVYDLVHYLANTDKLEEGNNDTKLLLLKILNRIK